MVHRLEFLGRCHAVYGLHHCWHGFPFINCGAHYTKFPVHSNATPKTAKSRRRQTRMKESESEMLSKAAVSSTASSAASATSRKPSSIRFHPST